MTNNALVNLMSKLYKLYCLFDVNLNYDFRLLILDRLINLNDFYFSPIALIVSGQVERKALLLIHQMAAHRGLLFTQSTQGLLA